jgi:nucleotide-binding universal stress UspA family protein
MQALQVVNKIAFKNILFLTDFTEASGAAMAYATGLARHFGAQLYPAHACDPVILTETAGTDILQGVEDNSREQLITLAQKTGVPCTPLFVRGAVEQAVPHWITEHGIDLVVMGTHGRKGLQHFLMGSVAEAVFRSATCPVLTVGPHVTTRPYHEFKVESVLFPTDLGDHAQFATQYALSIAEENNADLTLMHVVPPSEAFHTDRSTAFENAYKRMDKIVPAEARDWCKPVSVVKVGDPAKELLEYANMERPDLIVLGLPAQKKFNGHFRTGVTYNVIAGAPCPVLTVRDLTTGN